MGLVAARSSTAAVREIMQISALLLAGEGGANAEIVRRCQVSVAAHTRCEQGDEDAARGV